MIAVASVVLLAMVQGALFLRRSRTALRWAFLPLSFLIGMGAITLTLLALSPFSWSRVVAFPGLLCTAALMFVAGGKMPEAAGKELPAPRSPWIVTALVDLVTLALVAGHAIFATLAAPALHDFLAIWGLKAKEFWFAGGVDWTFLTSRWNAFAHPDYPLLVPLTYDAVAVMNGHWNDRWLGAFTTLFGLALLAIIRQLLREEVPEPFAAAGTLILASMVLNPWVGLAEAPLVAYTTGAVLFLRRGIGESCSTSVIAGAVLAGLGAWTKNEGMSFAVAAVVVALLLARPRKPLCLLPALLIPAPWMLLRWLHRLESDLFVGNAGGRLAQRAFHPGPFILAIGHERLGSTLFVAALAAGVALTVGRLARSEKVVLLTVGFQFAFCIVTYLATANDVTWQVHWSWERVMAHLMVPLQVAVVAALLAMAAARSRAQAA